MLPYALSLTISDACVFVKIFVLEMPGIKDLQTFWHAIISTYTVIYACDSLESSKQTSPWCSSLSSEMLSRRSWLQTLIALYQNRWSPGKKVLVQIWSHWRCTVQHVYTGSSSCFRCRRPKIDITCKQWYVTKHAAIEFFCSAQLLPTELSLVVKHLTMHQEVVDLSAR